MASGMYSKHYPSQMLFKTYGFERVDAEREQEIVARLRRHTNSSAKAAAEVENAGAELCAKRPLRAQHRCVCPKVRTAEGKGLAGC